ncbi:MAG: hypothetical protein ACE5GQ_03405 [Nitrospinales bacterium]
MEFSELLAGNAWRRQAPLPLKEPLRRERNRLLMLIEGGLLVDKLGAPRILRSLRTATKFFA